MTELGALFGRPDLERVGLFSEMPYMHGAKYPWPKQDLIKGANMLAEGLKVKVGKADCYFDKEFKRIFESEAIKGRRKEKPKKSKPISTLPFMPVGPSKKHATPGDYYGSFQKFEHFSPKLRPQPAYKGGVKRNFVTNPGKKGGYGYNNICINKYPQHSAYRQSLKPEYKEYGTILNGPLVTSHYPSAYFDKNPFPDPPNMKPGKIYIKPKEKLGDIIGDKNFVPTGPGKSLGGCKCGGFEKFPEHKPNKYITVWDLNKPTKHFGGTWHPQSTAEKTLHTFSTITENVRFRLNERTLGKLGPSYTKYIVT